LVQLEWSTASEISNERFNIERKLKSETSFSFIGTVVGAGNSTSLLNYSFLDDLRGLSGIICYRLKQVDYDGNYSYTEVRCISFLGESQVEVYPNPTNSELTIELSVDEQSSIRLTDQLGIVHRQISTTDRINKIDLGDLSSGVYYLDVNGKVFKVLKN